MASIGTVYVTSKVVWVGDLDLLDELCPDGTFWELIDERGWPAGALMGCQEAQHMLDMRS